MFRNFTQNELSIYLLAARPDGPLFGLCNETERHIVAPSYTRGVNDGWYTAHCYVCAKSERFWMRGWVFFDPFTGEEIAADFDNALRAGMVIRSEWMRRRKALRALKG